MAISKDDVKQAMQTLAEEGMLQPSAGKIRDVLKTGGMGTIQKYLNEIREEYAKAEEASAEGEKAEVMPVYVDKKMVQEYMQVIIENVSAATRSQYLEQIINLTSSNEELELALKTEKTNYAELEADYEEQVAKKEGFEMLTKENAEALKAQETLMVEKQNEFEKIIQERNKVEMEKDQAHEREMIAMKAANEQMTRLVDSITKRIGVTTESESK